MNKIGPEMHITPPDERFCVYCWDLATVRDHVPPVSSYCRVGRKRKGKLRSLSTVPSCYECNALLSDLLLLTIPERANYIAHKLRIRYAKLLSSPDWELDELQNVENNLFYSIVQSRKKKELVQLRIAVATKISVSL